MSRSLNSPPSFTTTQPLVQAVSYRCGTLTLLVYIGRVSRNEPTDFNHIFKHRYFLQHLLQLFIKVQQFPKTLMLLQCFLGVMPMLQGILVPQRRTGRAAAVHSASAVRHCRSLAGCAFAGLGSAAGSLAGK